MGKYRLNSEDFLWLWETNRYDGFLAGYASYKKQPVYVTCKREFMFYEPGPIVNGIEDIDQRKYWNHRILSVYSITPEQFWDANVHHLKWRECVGWNSDLEPAFMFKRMRDLPYILQQDFVKRKGYDAYKKWADKNPLQPLSLTQDNFVGYLHF